MLSKEIAPFCQNFLQNSSELSSRKWSYIPLKMATSVCHLTKNNCWREKLKKSLLRPPFWRLRHRLRNKLFILNRHIWNKQVIYILYCHSTECNSFFFFFFLKMNKSWNKALFMLANMTFVCFYLSFIGLCLSEVTCIGLWNSAVSVFDSGSEILLPYIYRY